MPLTRRDFERLLEFRVTLRQFQRWSEDQARAAGLTQVQHQLLVAVKGHRGTAAGDRILRQLTPAHLDHLHELAEILDELVTKNDAAEAP